MRAISKLYCAHAFDIALNAIRRDHCEIIGDCEVVAAAVQTISELACPNTEAVPSVELGNTRWLESYDSLKLICKSSNTLEANPGIPCLRHGVRETVSHQEMPPYIFLGLLVSGSCGWMSSNLIGLAIEESRCFLVPQSWFGGITLGALLGAVVGTTQSMAQAALGSAMLKVFAPELGISARDSLTQAYLGALVVGGTLGAIMVNDFHGPDNRLEEDPALVAGVVARVSGFFSTLGAGPLGSVLWHLANLSGQGATQSFLAQACGAGLLPIAGVTFSIGLSGVASVLGCLARSGREIAQVGREIARSGLERAQSGREIRALPERLEIAQNHLNTD